MIEDDDDYYDRDEHLFDVFAFGAFLFSLIIVIIDTHYTWWPKSEPYFLWIFDQVTNCYTWSRLKYRKLRIQICNIPENQQIITQILLFHRDQKQVTGQRLGEPVYTSPNLKIDDITMVDKLKKKPSTFDWNRFAPKQTELDDALETRIEIHYRLEYASNPEQEGSEYILIFPYKSKIKFPIYTSAQIKQGNAGLMEYWEEVYFPNCPSEINDDDWHNKVYDALDKYAGPCGNFYRGLPSTYLKSHWIMLETDLLFKKGDKLTFVDTLGDYFQLD